jgi:DNA polymerase-3 subunit delta'
MLPCVLISGSDGSGRLKKAEEILGIKLETEQNNPDLLVLSPELSIGIDEIRNLQKFLQLKPFKEKRKIVVILEAQKLTTEAQNSLLKTLEEPPSDSFIILAVSVLSLMLPTIISRCEIVELSAKTQITLSPQEIEERIKDFSEMLSLGIGKNLVKIEKEGIAKDRKTATEWLNALSLVVRQIMLSKYKGTEKESGGESLKKYSGKDLTVVLSLIAEAVKKLEANCGVRLVLDNFDIELNANF